MYASKQLIIVPRFVYGYSSNHPRSGVYGPATMELGDSVDTNLPQAQGKTATTSFIYGPPLSHPHLDLELNQIQMPVECDNRINNGRNILGNGGRFMTDSQHPASTGQSQVLGFRNSIPSKFDNSDIKATNNSKVSGQQQQHNPGNNLRSEYTIAV